MVEGKMPTKAIVLPFIQMWGLLAKGTFNQIREGSNAGMSRNHLKHQSQDNTQPTSGSSPCECKASGHTSAGTLDGRQLHSTKITRYGRGSILVPMHFHTKVRKRVDIHKGKHRKIEILEPSLSASDSCPHQCQMRPTIHK